MNFFDGPLVFTLTRFHCSFYTHKEVCLMCRRKSHPHLIYAIPVQSLFLCWVLLVLTLKLLSNYWADGVWCCDTGSHCKHLLCPLVTQTLSQPLDQPLCSFGLLCIPALSTRAKHTHVNSHSAGLLWCIYTQGHALAYFQFSVGLLDQRERERVCVCMRAFNFVI